MGCFLKAALSRIKWSDNFMKIEEIPFGMILFGALAIVLGIGCLRNYYTDQKRGYEIIYGRVVQLKRRAGRKAGSKFSTIGYTPVFEYEYRGKIYQKEHRVESSKYGKGMKIEPASKYKEGDIVELRVYVDEPEYALANDEKNIKMPLYVGIPITLVGMAVLVIAVLIGMGWL